MKEDFAAARNVLKENKKQLLTRAHVIATGIGYKITEGRKTSDLSMICSVTEKLPVSRLSTKDVVPQTLNGIPLDVIETGPIRAFPSRTSRQRPAPGGVSIGHRNITAGTLGCLVKKNGDIFILSNNHVLANSNDARTGDSILQPGPIDGGRHPQDRIAKLHDFVPIVFPDTPSRCAAANGLVKLLNALARIVGSRARLKAVSIRTGENLVDAAIAQPIDEKDVSAEILEIGTIKGVAEADLGTAVKKSGRTTGFTTGEIQQIDVTVDVDYGAGRIGRFTDQLLAGDMSQGGDSGSAVLDGNNNIVGLLFAGSDTSTIINRIQNVFSALEVRL
jgi:hypothetical protein